MSTRRSTRNSRGGANVNGGEGAGDVGGGEGGGQNAVNNNEQRNNNEVVAQQVVQDVRDEGGQALLNQGGQNIPNHGGQDAANQRDEGGHGVRNGVQDLVNDRDQWEIRVGARGGGGRGGGGRGGGRGGTRGGYHPYSQTPKFVTYGEFKALETRVKTLERSFGHMQKQKEKDKFQNLEEKLNNIVECIQQLQAVKNSPTPSEASAAAGSATRTAPPYVPVPVASATLPPAPTIPFPQIRYIQPPQGNVYYTYPNNYQGNC